MASPNHIAQVTKQHQHDRIVDTEEDREHCVERDKSQTLARQFARARRNAEESCKPRTMVSVKFA